MLGQADLNLIPFDTHGQDRQITDDRRSKPLSGLDLEATSMERALDDIAIKPSVTQERIGVSADIVSGIYLPVYALQRDIEVASLDADDFPGVDSIQVGNLDPVFRATHLWVSSEVMRSATKLL